MIFLSIAIFSALLAAGLYNRALCIQLFIVIFMVFPDTMPFIGFFGLGLIKASTVLVFVLNCYKSGPKLSVNYVSILVVFTILILPSYLFAENSTGIYLYFSQFFVYTFLPGITIYKYINDTNNLKSVYKAICFAFFVMCCYGLFELVSNYNPFIEGLRAYSTKETVFEYTGVNKVRLGFSRRIQSTSWHPIAFGGYLSIFIPIILCPLFDINSSIVPNPLKPFAKNKLIILILLALMLFNLFVCLSRSAWVAGIVALAYIIFSHRKYLMYGKKELKYIALFVSLPIACYGIYYIVDKLSHVTYGGSSTELRKAQAEYVYNLVKNDLAIGLGDSAISNIISKGLSGQAFGFESTLMAFPVNHGLIGSLGYFLLYLSTFVLLMRPNKTVFTAFFHATLIAHIAFSVLTGEMKTTTMFWFLFSIFYAAHVNQLKPKTIFILDKQPKV